MGEGKHLVVCHHQSLANRHCGQHQGMTWNVHNWHVTENDNDELPL